MNKEKAFKLMNFIDESKSYFHASENFKNILLENKFTPLYEGDKWNLSKGKKYFVEKNNSAIIAFEIGNGSLSEDGFRIIGSHLDSPGFKIKPNPEIISEGTYIKLNTEVYGGPILSTWFDRPLGVAGKVVLKNNNILKPLVKLFDSEKPLVIIPNLAIHFNREVNTGYSFNPQVDTLPILSLLNETFEKENSLINYICQKLNVEEKNILDFELFLYDFEKGKLVGLNDEFINIGKLDDLWMAYSSLEAFLASEKNSATKVLALLNSEELGNETAEGAESVFLYNTLKRISNNSEQDEEDFFRSLSNTIVVSADLAHGVHPNYLDKHDPTNRPVLGGGPVLKYSAKKKYATDSVSGAIFKSICESKNIPYQIFVNRSDVPGGSTMGPVFSFKLGCTVIDMGAPIFSMHSIRELGAISDVLHTENFFKEFFTV